jgi:signal transduction histidine kinase
MAAGDRLRVRPPARHWPWSKDGPSNPSLTKPPLPRRPALGLRGRIIGAVLVTTVATLGVAALALLGPLEQSLRNAEKQTLRHELRKSTIRQFKALPLNRLPSADVAQDLYQAQQQLGVRIGGSATVLGYPEASGLGKPLLPDSREGATVNADQFDDVARAFSTHRSVYSFGFISGDDYARAAIPFTAGGVRFVLAVRKPIDEIAGAVRTVRNAFITAALAGLLLTLILGIPLSARLVRRLRRLRQAALEVAQEGPEVDVPVDRARDEVGDLARSLKTMQQRLSQQEEARRSFVATASHELRTPLTSLDGMLELLDDDLRYEHPDLEDARALLHRARVQSRRLARLAADLLDLSRIDAQSALRSEPVELGELSRAVLAEFELGTAERGIETELDDHGGSVWALGDPGSIARILRILLDNAVRISPPSSKLRVRLRTGDQVALSVCDQGPGVPPEDREQIFRRFARGRDTGGQAGFGLGLAIGRELAERMGGSLELEETTGPGATFTLRLPADRTPARTLLPAPS